jgi:hypothetical protein
MVSQKLPSSPCSGPCEPPPSAEDQKEHKIQLQRLAEAMIKRSHSASTEDKLRAQVLLSFLWECVPSLCPLLLPSCLNV